MEMGWKGVFGSRKYFRSTYFLLFLFVVLSIVPVECDHESVLSYYCNSEGGVCYTHCPVGMREIGRWPLCFEENKGCCIYETATSTINIDTGCSRRGGSCMTTCYDSNSEYIGREGLCNLGVCCAILATGSMPCYLFGAECRPQCGQNQLQLSSQAFCANGACCTEAVTQEATSSTSTDSALTTTSSSLPGSVPTTAVKRSTVTTSTGVSVPTTGVGSSVTTSTTDTSVTNKPVTSSVAAITSTTEIKNTKAFTIPAESTTSEASSTAITNIGARTTMPPTTTTTESRTTETPPTTAATELTTTTLTTTTPTETSTTKASITPTGAGTTKAPTTSESSTTGVPTTTTIVVTTESRTTGAPSSTTTESKTTNAPTTTSIQFTTTKAPPTTHIATTDTYSRTTSSPPTITIPESSTTKAPTSTTSESRTTIESQTTHPTPASTVTTAKSSPTAIYSSEATSAKLTHPPDIPTSKAQTTPRHNTDSPGLKEEECRARISGRSFGGSPSIECSWPEIALVKINVGPPVNYQIYVTGALISNNTVVVNGNAIQEFDSLSTSLGGIADVTLEVTVGKDDIRIKQSEEITFEVVDWKVVDGYSDENIPENDLAVLKLSGSVSMSDCVKPACLQTNFTTYRENEMCKLVGWATQPGGAGTPFPLALTADVDVMTKHVCLSSINTLPDGVICSITPAGATKSPTSLCDADAGRMLMCKSVSGAWILRGIVSKEICDSGNSLTVVTDIASHKAWLEEMKNL